MTLATIKQAGITTVHRKILAGEKLANRELFAKIFPANIYRYTTNVFGIYVYALTLAYSPNFS